MNQNMVGADVAGLRQLAQSFDHAATQLQSTSGRVRSGIQISAWIGAGATRFRVTWDSDHSVALRRVAGELTAAATRLRQEADQQERASSPSGAGASFGSSGGAARTSGGSGFDLPGALASGISTFNDWSGLPGFVGDLYDTASKVPWAEKLPHGSYLSAGLKGLGLGEALGGLATGVRDHDLAGTVSSAGDLGFTFAAAPVSALWTGLKSEIGFFIPLDGPSMDNHLSWMHERGYSSDQISDRYSGVQGFIDLGNDNVERQAPWLNRIADAAMAKPAEWLYNAGIKL